MKAKDPARLKRTMKAKDPARLNATCPASTNPHGNAFVEPAYKSWL
jgi:hypothetical protein